MARRLQNGKEEEHSQPTKAARLLKWDWKLHFPQGNVQWSLHGYYIHLANTQSFLVVESEFHIFWQLKNLSLVKKNKTKDTKQTMATEAPEECNECNERQQQ